MTAYGRLVGLKDGLGQLDTSESLAYTIRVSDDDLTYTVRLREGLTFTDGRPVDSKAALFTFDRLMASEAGRSLFPHLRGFTIIGDYTFSLALSQPWPPFMASLALPQASLISPGLGDRPEGFLNDHTLGSGRFMVEAASPTALSLVLRPDLPSRPKLDRVEFYYAADPTERLALFLEKEAHLAVEPPAMGLPADRALLELPTWETRFLAFNVKSPYLAILGVREALAILAKEAFSQAKFKPKGYFPAGLFGGPSPPGPAGGLARAKELLLAIGSPKTPLTLAYPGDEPAAQVDAETLGAAFHAHNVPVNLLPLRGQPGRAVAEAGDYDFWLGSRTPQIPSPEMWLGQFLESTAAGRGNPAYFSDREADETIRGFRASLPRDQRERKVGELDALAEKAAPYVFLYQKPKRFLADQRLANQKTHPMWPEVWPIQSVNLNPFKGPQPKAPAPPTPVREFDELVAEPWE
jgi:peptide/nickel transport system substrate-binding protein